MNLIIELHIAAELRHNVHLMTASQEGLLISAVPIVNITVLHYRKVVSNVIVVRTVPFCKLFTTALMAALLDRMKHASVNMNWARKKTKPWRALRCLPEYACRGEGNRYKSLLSLQYCGWVKLWRFLDVSYSDEE
jgi:hypothetical protein